MSATDLIPLALAFVGGVFGGLALAGLAAAWRERQRVRDLDRRTWEERATWNRCNWDVPPSIWVRSGGVRK